MNQPQLESIRANTPIPSSNRDGSYSLWRGIKTSNNMFALEKTNAELVKDSCSNLGINDVEVKLAISDMYDVQHVVNPELSFDPAGGQWEDGTSAVKKYEPALESEFAIIDAPTRDGYTFVCWKGSEYQPGDEYHADSDHVFTAEWKSNEEPAPPSDEPSDDPAGPASADNAGGDGNANDDKASSSKQSSDSSSVPKMGDVASFAALVGSIAVLAAIAIMFNLKRRHKAKIVGDVIDKLE